MREDEEIPLAGLVSVIARTHGIMMNYRLRPYDLSSGQFPLLMHLSHQQNITQESLARHLHLDKGAIARAARKLEDTGYISRTPDPVNRRAFRLLLTEKGEQIVSKIQMIDQEWDDQVCDGLSPEERVDLNALLNRIAMNCIRNIRNREEPSHDRI
ncbi:MarR family winged helix-turn-helix transcriptional regulator [Methanosphaerula palustris]|uniref:Transcriptional regulator, MarR family n=1 Tax=Methanosphaerula palustris (strain ATCC BAA-1556 / DSM 19958 / E1-9c) TaxID=521011 RepID=B8GJC6_METPE|nr:MarR family transcriptional regulator [Methanosphaerula palustris]ACL16967.1 transcriptional regulator, MarR family [Methanosphaerula palustris E1-9c]